jgi:hypothetical protein
MSDFAPLFESEKAVEIHTRLGWVVSSYMQTSSLNQKIRESQPGYETAQAGQLSDNSTSFITARLASLTITSAMRPIFLHYNIQQLDIKVPRALHNALPVPKPAP